MRLRACIFFNVVSGNSSFCTPLRRSFVSSSSKLAVSPTKRKKGFVFWACLLASKAAYNAVVPLRINPCRKGYITFFLVVICNTSFRSKQETTCVEIAPVGQAFWHDSAVFAAFHHLLPLANGRFRRAYPSRQLLVA